MTDVLVRRCTLRVVRRGGWSWGPDPRRLLRGVVEALPALLAARLAKLGWDGDEVIEEPVRLRVPVRRLELAALAAGAGGVERTAELAARLARALGEVLVEPPAAAASAGPAAVHPPAAPALGPVTPPTDGALLLGRLLDWHRRGLLGRVLAALPAGLVELWWERLNETLPTPPTAGSGSDGTDGTIEAPVLEQPGSGSLPLAPAARRLLALAAAAPGAAPGDVARTASLTGLRRTVAAPETVRRPMPPTTDEPAPDEDRRGPAPASPWRITDRPAPAAVAPAPRRDALRSRFDGEVRVASALPWLLLGPLSRTGYLATLAAALRLADEETAAPCFAAALATKVLVPPERGWVRGAEAVATAAAFAGVEAPLHDALLTSFARRFEPFAALLDADLAQGTLAGRDAAEPLLLVDLPEAAGGGLLLLDPGGLFPVAASEAGAAGAATLAAVLGAGGEAAFAGDLLVPAPAAHPQLLAGLDAAGLAFVTPAPPARGERWRRLPVPGRWWTNRPSRRRGALAPRLRDLDELAASAGELARELTVRRPAVPRAAVTRFERSVTLAAACALGALAWTLWRDREPTHPLLALERLADLDGRVRFTRDAVHLRLPLGRRHRDLYHAGLLAPVRDVPWLGGRAVEITGG